VQSERGKVGRNDPCWCGSGEKYKRCHEDREKAAPVNPFALEQQHKRILGKKLCLHPEASERKCSGSIVKAHTVQRSGGLSRIAVDGHVLVFDSSIATMLANRGALVPERIGINRASTFTGFCGYHDSSTFVEIEQKPSQATPKQNTLLGYRGLCRELFVKSAAYEALPLLRQTDRGNGPSCQRLADRQFSERPCTVRKDF
jgi:hypothetical protein